jgi:hypothetical protein
LRMAWALGFLRCDGTFVLSNRRIRIATGTSSP